MESVNIFSSNFPSTTMKKVLTYKGAVMTWECDSNGHMNVMYYVNKFENAGRNFDLNLGLMNEVQRDNTGIVVLEQNIKYHQEVFEDDLIYIESSLLDVGNKAFTVFHEMYNGRTKNLVSTMQVTLVLFNKIERKALPFPESRRTILLKALNP